MEKCGVGNGAAWCDICKDVPHEIRARRTKNGLEIVWKCMANDIEEAGYKQPSKVKAGALRRAEEMADLFHDVKPRTDVASPERYMGLPALKPGPRGPYKKRNSS
jgi:hypothetical protein